jgi:hypothetical protein
MRSDRQRLGAIAQSLAEIGSGLGQGEHWCGFYLRKSLFLTTEILLRLVSAIQVQTRISLTTELYKLCKISHWPLFWLVWSGFGCHIVSWRHVTVLTQMRPAARSYDPDCPRAGKGSQRGRKKEWGLWMGAAPYWLMIQIHCKEAG